MKVTPKCFVCLHDDQDVISGILMRSWEERKNQKLEARKKGP